MEKKDYIEYLEKEHKKAKEQGKTLEYQGICVSALIEELNELKNCNFIKLRDDLIIPKDKVGELVEKLEVLEILENKSVDISCFKRERNNCRNIFGTFEYKDYERHHTYFSNEKLTRDEFNKLKNYFERKK